MYTPKEKAIELYNKYWDLLFTDSDIRNKNNTSKTKECALICIDEIKQTVKRTSSKNVDYYYNKVKNEISKL